MAQLKNPDFPSFPHPNLFVSLSPSTSLPLDPNPHPRNPNLRDRASEEEGAMPATATATAVADDEVTGAQFPNPVLLGFARESGVEGARVATTAGG